MNPKSNRGWRGFVAVVTLAGLVGGWACDSNVRSPAPGGERSALTASPLQPRGTIQRAELRAEGGVIDGDTLRAVGFDQSIRLLCLDTEELFDEEEGEREVALSDWEEYQQGKTGEADRPLSYGTFLGERAREFANEFFAGHDEIFVEYQSPRQTRGFFGRHLAYVWVRDGEDGRFRNYNIEAVRAGMSPYYTAYGRCDAYHEHFLAAQAEARRKGLGIWGEAARGYDDYDERLRRWDRRAKQIELFRSHFENHRGVVELGTDTAMARLRLMVGRRAVVFGALERHSPGARPPKLTFQHRYREGFVAVADEGLTFEIYNVELDPGQYYYVEGEVEMYRGNPQLRVDGGGFLRHGATPPPLPPSR